MREIYIPTTFYLNISMENKPEKKKQRNNNNFFKIKRNSQFLHFYEEMQLKPGS